MPATDQSPIKVSTHIALPVEKVWMYWSDPAHIVNWNNASDDWHTPSAENDLRVGGKFVSTMAAKDGSVSFNFEGEYTEVQEHQLIVYKLGDQRVVRIDFVGDANGTDMTETFDPEQTHTREMQQAGWQSILDNFKKYAEEKG